MMHSMKSGQSLSGAVLAAVARREGVGPEQLRPRLYEVVDPDALDSLFRDGTGQLSFLYLGYLVTVDQSGHVDIEVAEAD